MATYKLIWDDFCSWLLEVVKPAYGASIDKDTYDQVCTLFEDNLRLLHPFMPFLSEELWHAFASRSTEEALIISDWPEQQSYDQDLLTSFAHTAELITQLRSLRKNQNISFKEAIQVLQTKEDKVSLKPLVLKLAHVESWSEVAQAPAQALSFRVNKQEYFVPVAASNLEEERAKMEEELSYLEGFLKSVEKKLANERFVANAPQQVVAMEQKKADDARTKINALRKRLS